ncbi:hypothetical protein D3C71_1557640 [compost metagenome]
MAACLNSSWPIEIQTTQVMVAPIIAKDISVRLRFESLVRVRDLTMPRRTTALV